MSAIPMQSMNAKHVKNVRRAFNKRHDAVAAIGTLNRSHSSDARLDDHHASHHHHTNNHKHHSIHEQRREFHSASPPASNQTKSEPTSRRSKSPVAAAFTRPEAWNFNLKAAMQPTTWTCTYGVGRVIEMASQKFGGTCRS